MLCHKGGGISSVDFSVRNDLFEGSLVDAVH